MPLALAFAPDGAGALQELDEAGRPLGAPRLLAGTAEVAAAVAVAQQHGEPRWVLADVAAGYPALVRAGARVRRAHDVAAAQALLLAAEGDAAGAAEATAARTAAMASAVGAGEGGGQQSLFYAVPATAPGAGGAGGAGGHGTGDTGGAGGHGTGDTGGAGGADGADLGARVTALGAAYAAQLERLAALREHLPGLGLLVAAESASCLAAVEMTAVGLPWDAPTHDRLLVELLGPRPASAAARPARLQALAEEVSAALEDPRLNVDSHADVLRALRRAGLPVTSTRRHELRRHEHPVVEALVRYRELARLHTAHGWAWRDQWVHEGRFHPEYVPGGVVSGRWATRGGGALQIPKPVRAAVVAPPGHVLVVADAGQLEPRVLAALARDPGMTAATAEGDLYTALAREALGRPEARAEMKVALLAAMYGGGAGSPALAALRRRFPAALALLEAAAATGESGGSVRSVLGRTSPPPQPDWLSGLPDAAAAARSRAWGRFTRNFVVQASAADWAAVLLATLRQRLAGLTAGGGFAELVFFQHDEVVVEADAGLAAEAVAAVAEAGTTATRLVLGDTGVHVPLVARAVRSYGEG